MEAAPCGGGLLDDSCAGRRTTHAQVQVRLDQTCAPPLAHVVRPLDDESAGRPLDDEGAGWPLDDAGAGQVMRLVLLDTAMDAIVGAPRFPAVVERAAHVAAWLLSLQAYSSSGVQGSDAAPIGAHSSAPGLDLVVLMGVHAEPARTILLDACAQVSPLFSLTLVLRSPPYSP